MNKKILYQIHKLIQMNQKEKWLDNKMFYQIKKNKLKKLINL